MNYPIKTQLQALLWQYSFYFLSLCCTAITVYQHVHCLTYQFRLENLKSYEKSLSVPIGVMQPYNIRRTDIGWENSGGINARLSATLLDPREWYIVNIKHLQKKIWCSSWNWETYWRLFVYHVIRTFRSNDASTTEATKTGLLKPSVKYSQHERH